MAEHTTKYGWCETEELFKKLQHHVNVTGQTDTLLVELVSRLDDLLDEHEEFMRLSDEHEILKAKCDELEEQLEDIKRELATVVAEREKLDAYVDELEEKLEALQSDRETNT